MGFQVAKTGLKMVETDLEVAARWLETKSMLFTVFPGVDDRTYLVHSGSPYLCGRALSTMDVVVESTWLLGLNLRLDANMLKGREREKLVA